MRCATICSMSLDEYRKEIDKIDDQIVVLLNHRYQVVEKIKTEKEKTGQTIHDPTREAAALNRMAQALQMPFSLEMLKDIYSVIFASSRKIQQH